MLRRAAVRTESDKERGNFKLPGCIHTNTILTVEDYKKIKLKYQHYIGVYISIYANIFL
jgi:hypothetical protein